MNHWFHQISNGLNLKVKISKISIKSLHTHFGYIKDNKKELDESLISSDFKWVKFKKESLLDKYNELATFTFLGVESEKYLDYFWSQFNNKTEE